MQYHWGMRKNLGMPLPGGSLTTIDISQRTMGLFDQDIR